MNQIQRSRKPWPDVPRLLQRRRHFQDLGDHSVASSVTAFLAWKAFLIVARGSSSGAEKDQCATLTSSMLSQHSDLWLPAVEFAKALKPLSRQTDMMLGDWYADPALSPREFENRVRWARRSIVKLNKDLSSGDRGEAVSKALTDHAYAIRSAVLAHGAIHSTGNLFELIVPAFEEFVSQVACAGYAERARIPLAEALEECRVIS